MNVRVCVRGGGLRGALVEQEVVLVVGREDRDFVQQIGEHRVPARVRVRPHPCRYPCSLTARLSAVHVSQEPRTESVDIHPRRECARYKSAVFAVANSSIAALRASATCAGETGRPAGPAHTHRPSACTHAQAHAGTRISTCTHAQAHQHAHAHALRTGLRMTDHWDVIGFGGTARNVPLAISLARTESIAAPTPQATRHCAVESSGLCSPVDRSRRRAAPRAAPPPRGTRAAVRG